MIAKTSQIDTSIYTKKPTEKKAKEIKTEDDVDRFINESIGMFKVTCIYKDKPINFNLYPATKPTLSILCITIDKVLDKDIVDSFMRKLDSIE